LLEVFELCYLKPSIPPQAEELKGTLPTVPSNTVQNCDQVFETFAPKNGDVAMKVLVEQL
jgi:hypothetical protein